MVVKKISIVFLVSYLVCCLYVKTAAQEKSSSDIVKSYEQKQIIAHNEKTIKAALTTLKKDVIALQVMQPSEYDERVFTIIREIADPNISVIIDAAIFLKNKAAGNAQLQAASIELSSFIMSLSDVHAQLSMPGMSSVQDLGDGTLFIAEVFISKLSRLRAVIGKQVKKLNAEYIVNVSRRSARSVLNAVYGVLDMLFSQLNRGAMADATQLPIGVKDNILRKMGEIRAHGALGTALLSALARSIPVVGYELSQEDLQQRGGYVPAARQQEPRSLSLKEEKVWLSEQMQKTNDESLKSQYAQELTIVNAVDQYRPVFYLHPKDMAGPVDPADFFAGLTTAVRQGNYRTGVGRFVIPAGKVTYANLANLTAENPGEKYSIWHAMPDKPHLYDRRILYGSDPRHFGRYATAANNRAIPMHVTTFYGKKKLIRDGEIVRDKHGNTLCERDEQGNCVADTTYFYIQYLCLYGYNQPYDISVPIAPLFKGDVYDFQNAHEADLEHITIKVNAETGHIDSIYYGSHGRDEGMWMYPPGSRGGDADQEFTVDQSGRPEVFVAYGGHGNYPKVGVYTRIYGIANDVTARGPQWELNENTIYRTVRKESAGFNPLVHTYNRLTYLDWIGDLGPRGVASFRTKSWAGNIEEEDKGRDAKTVHRKHFCSEDDTGTSMCVREKAKNSPPPGGERPWIIKILQDIGVL